MFFWSCRVWVVPVLHNSMYFNVIVICCWSCRHWQLEGSQSSKKLCKTIWMLSKRFRRCRLVLPQVRFWRVNCNTTYAYWMPCHNYRLYIRVCSWWLWLIDVQDKLDDQDYILSSQQYQSLNEQVQDLRIEVEKCRALVDQLQVFGCLQATQSLTPNGYKWPLS